MSETAFEAQAVFVTYGVGEEALSFLKSLERESLEDLGRRLNLYINSAALGCKLFT